jgi:hypothetical protein
MNVNDQPTRKKAIGQAGLPAIEQEVRNHLIKMATFDRWVAVLRLCRIES